jgi:group I intron endonuclease
MRILLYAKRIYLAPSSEKVIISLENRNQAGVYALICKVTNRFYIGSSVYLGARLLDYMQPAYLAQLVNRPILKALRKYGVNNWIFIVLETCQASVVLEREQYWLDLLEPEYNLSPTAGSTLGVAVSVEARAKLRAAHLGKTHSLEACLLMSETRRGSNNPMFGKTISSEAKIQLSLALKGPNGPLSGVPRSPETIKLMRANHPHTKRVYQYDLDRLTLISQYDSIRQAAKLTGISRAYLCRCLSENTLVCGKWFFSYSAPV